MSLEERVSRLEERLAELLIRQATANEQYEALLERLLELEAKNAQTEARLSQTEENLATSLIRLDNIANRVGLLPDELDLPQPFNLYAWVAVGLARQAN